MSRDRATPAVRDVTLGQLLEQAARSAPDRIALIAGHPEPALRRQWTYSELYAEAERTARALLTRFKPGERIAVWAQNLPEWVMLEFGTALAGMVLVTVNPGFRARELEYVLKQSRSAGVFVVHAFRGNPMLETVHEVAPHCPELREIICFDDWPSFIAAGDDKSIALPAVKPTDPVMIQYTSGTTGFPKGALLHHRGLANNGADTAERMGIDAGLCVHHHHAAVPHRRLRLLRARRGVQGRDPGAVGGVRAGPRARTVRDLSRQCHARRADHAGRDAGASLLRIIRSFLGQGDLFGRLDRAGRARHPVRAETGRALHHRVRADRVLAGGGPDHDHRHDRGQGRTIGLPLPNMENKIVNPNTGETCAIGEIGEFCTRGYHIMLGYFEMPEATAAAIDADGWLHTGDLCAMDARGYCTVEGRLKDMIIRGGENIYPRELEELLFRHPKVGEVAVVGLPHEKWGEEVAAFIRAAPGATIDKEELSAYMRASLAPHKTPKHWFVVEAFPLTGSGKIQKFKLREAWTKGEVDGL